MKQFDSSALIDKTTSCLILGAAFASPLLVLPFTNNILGHAKDLVLLGSAVLIGFAYLIDTLRKKGWELTLSPLTLPLVLFGLAVGASSFFTSQYPVEALLGAGGSMLAAVFIAVFGGSLLSSVKAQKFIDVFGISAAVLSTASLLQMVGWGPSRIINMMPGFGIPNNLSFALTGSSINSLVVIVLALVGVVAQVVFSKKLSTLHSVLVPVLLIGVGINLWASLPGKETSIPLPPAGASWTIAIDSMRSPRNAIIGQGPQAYSNTYARLRPNWLNGLNTWQLNFNSAANVPLTLVVTTGLVGVTTWIFLVVKVFQQLRKKENRHLAVAWVVAASFIFNLLLPSSTVLLTIQAVALAVWIALRSKDSAKFRLEASAIRYIKDHADFLPKRMKTHSPWALFFTTGLAGVGLVFVSYFLARAFFAYYHLGQAELATVKNDVVKVYDHRRQAVIANPYLDEIRRSYSLTNLQIAIAMSNNADITDEQKSQVAQLVSQADAEARAAVELDQADYQNWAILAEIYKSLVGVSEEAPQNAVNAYVSAIQNYPTNPFFRIELGNLFYNKEQYQDAAGFFSQAINLKPDMPVGYYQLGKSLIQLQDYNQANQAWKQTLQLLDPTSEDYQVVQKSIEELEAAIEATKSAKPGQNSQINQDQDQNAADKTTPLSNLTDDSETTGINTPVAPLTQQQVDQAGSNVVNPSTDLDL